MNRNYAVVAGVVLSSVSALASASATSYYYPTYQVTNNAPNPITNIMEFWEAPSKGYGPGVLWSFGPDGMTADGNGATTGLGDAGKPVLPDGLLLMGLYNDTEGQHLVLFMDPTTATAVENIDFGTVFPNTDETQLIADITTIHSGVGDTNSAFNDLFGFVSGDASNIPNGDSTLSAWLAPAASNVASTGTIEMWSTGTQIGTFTAAVTHAGAVPSPAALVSFSIALMGLARRRARR